MHIILHKYMSSWLATYLTLRDSKGFSRLLRAASGQLQAAGGQWLGLQTVRAEPMIGTENGKRPSQPPKRM